MANINYLSVCSCVRHLYDLGVFCYHRGQWCLHVWTSTTSCPQKNGITACGRLMGYVVCSWRICCCVIDVQMCCVWIVPVLTCVLTFFRTKLCLVLPKKKSHTDLLLDMCLHTLMCVCMCVGGCVCMYIICV